MASLSDVTPFLRRPRMGSTPKARPIMKLEWNKLLAEATEKDTELKLNPVDKESYYDDDFGEMEDEEDTNDRIRNEGEEERPLNLCYKYHTMPSLGNQLQNSVDVLDLSSGKKILEENVKTPVNSGKNHSTVPNFQFNDVPGNRKDKLETVVENKENISGNKNIKNIYSTPFNKPLYQERNERLLSETEKCKKSIVDEKNNFKDNLKCYSERKATPNSIITERHKIIKEESNKVTPKLEKSGSPPKKEKVQTERKNGSLKVQNSVQTKQQQSSQSEKFAVPAVPAKPREATKVLVINKKSYQILAPLGKGGSSKVYLVLNAENELLAVKCVKLSDVSESTKNDYLNEIQHLLKMQHSKHVIKLHDHQYLKSQKLLFAVMERGDTDLSSFLKDKASSDEGISPELIMYYWTEMLMAVKSIHDNNIIHRDLKPANFLLVSGRLKLIDFGIASSIQTEQTSVLMESQSGTFNYMSPEALQDLGFDNKVVLKIGRKTDVWSLGCILYYFLYKKTPYQDLVKPLQKLKAITDPNYQVAFPKIPGVPDILIESCKRCLVHDTKKRASIEELLAFRNRPLFSLSQVLGRLETVLSREEYEKAAKAFAVEEASAL